MFVVNFFFFYIRCGDLMMVVGDYGKALWCWQQTRGAENGWELNGGAQHQKLINVGANGGWDIYASRNEYCVCARACTYGYDGPYKHSVYTTYNANLYLRKFESLFLNIKKTNESFGSKNKRYHQCLWWHTRAHTRFHTHTRAREHCLSIHEESVWRISLSRWSISYLKTEFINIRAADALPPPPLRRRHLPAAARIFFFHTVRLAFSWIILLHILSFAAFALFDMAFGWFLFTPDTLTFFLSLHIVGANSNFRMDPAHTHTRGTIPYLYRNLFYFIFIFG